ncbi:hypothetical protein TEA_024941 [Camellia sinensis var. sinensis]|uniref:PGG domain-containing protein n=1 Tax=Camellia sinensis var. sinensis TaxID=542762 RepID=A0A4V3WR02_CAMSN|nr:hypothetical protein TEA_024941 [Camellia sinensis var. sinensis]
MHDCTKLFVRMFCQKLQNSPEHSSILKKAFLLGAKNGIHEIVEEILVVVPEAISCVDEEEHSALHLAVMYRHEHVFNFIIQQMGVGKKLLLKVDNEGNNILHLVGRMPYQPQLEVVSGAVLQMQHEVQWYKEVEKLVPVQATTAMNHEGKTPMMVFEEDHRRMIQSEQQWIVSLASACTVSTTIIGTIAFSAAIQVPGGNRVNALIGYIISTQEPNSIRVNSTCLNIEHPYVPSNALKHGIRYLGFDFYSLLTNITCCQDLLTSGGLYSSQLYSPRVSSSHLESAYLSSVLFSATFFACSLTSTSPLLLFLTLGN